MYVRRRHKEVRRKDSALESALQSINATQQLEFSQIKAYCMAKKWLKYQNKEK